MMNLLQGDCRCGALGFAAGEDLSLAKGRLVKLNSGKDLVLPVSASDVTPYVVVVGADTGYLCGVNPLCSLANARVLLSGTCDAGDKLVSKGDGRVERTGEGNTGALLMGVAEEAGMDGQLVLLRPASAGGGEVGPQGPEGPQGPQGAPGEPGADGADGAAGFGLVEDAETGALSGGSGASAFGAGATAFGGGGSAGAADACAYGHSAAVTGEGGAAVGAYAYAAGARCLALGNSARAMPEGRVELASGYPAYSYGRISVQQNGAAMLSLAPAGGLAAYGYGDFDNPEGALPPGMWTASLNGDGTALVFYANVYGTVKSGTVALT